jgi:hypothetical protein
MLLGVTTWPGVSGRASGSRAAIRDGYRRGTMNRMQRLGALLAALLLLAVGGCADDEPADPGGAASPADETSETPTNDGSAQPSATPGSTATPASGEPIAGDTAVVRAPKGWQVEESGLGELVKAWTATEPQAFGTVRFDDLGPVDATTPQQLAEDGLTAFPRRPRPRLSFDVELDGEPAYHAVGKDDLTEVHEYGAVRGGSGVTLVFELNTYLSAKQRQRIVESVLASFRWS